MAVAVGQGKLNSNGARTDRAGTSRHQKNSVIPTSERDRR